jgi:hypothetical protein
MIIAMMLPFLTKVGILIDFKMNQDYIAKALCISKDKPVNTCNGKCHLSKQLEKAEEQEKKQTPANKTEKLELVYYYSRSSFEFSVYARVNSGKPNFALQNEFYSSAFVADIFHPPKFYLN